MSYHHEQVGRIYGWIIPAAAAFVLIVMRALPTAPVDIALGVFVAALFALLLASFARLTIDVENRGTRAPELRWSMTFGWPAGTIPIAEIADARIVSVSFWMGIGIHFTLGGWVWSVALGKGVRVRKQNGAGVILGTDDPEGLLAAIQRAR